MNEWLEPTSNRRDREEIKERSVPYKPYKAYMIVRYVSRLLNDSMNEIII